MADATTTSNKIIDLADRFGFIFAAFSGLWLALTCASYANFIRLPDFALLHGMPAIIASAMFNAGYWGFLYPRVQARRKERLDQNKVNANG
jgi:hypothetical protein